MSLRGVVVPVLSPLATASLHGVPLVVRAVRAAESVTEHVHLLVREELYGEVAEVMRRSGTGHAPTSVRSSLAHALSLMAQELPAVPHDPGVLVVHDPCCPMVSATTLRQVADRALAEPGTVVVASRLVTDTVKRVADGMVQETVDRDSLRTVSSPAALPVAALARERPRPEGPLLREPSGDDELAWLVADAVAGGAPLVWVPTLGQGRRVSSMAELRVLECVEDEHASRRTP